MTDNPEVVPGATQATKPCWVCGESIPYQNGWCQSCWIALGARQSLVILAHQIPDDTLQGDIFMAVTNSLKRERKPAPPPKPVKAPKFNLDDLEVPFR